VPFSLTYMKMRQVPLMFSPALRDSTKRIGFSEFGGTIAYLFWVAPHDRECACAYNNILRDCFPGNGRPRTLPLEIDGLARTSDELRSGPSRCHTAPRRYDGPQWHSGPRGISRLGCRFSVRLTEPISSGVFFTNTTSFPRDKKLLYTDAPAPYAAKRHGYRLRLGRQRNHVL